jgi:hypothetical protein
MEKKNEILANFFMIINLTMDGRINWGIVFLIYLRFDDKPKENSMVIWISIKSKWNKRKSAICKSFLSLKYLEVIKNLFKELKFFVI